MLDADERTTLSEFDCVVIGRGRGWVMLHCARGESTGLEALGAVRVAKSWPELYETATAKERNTVFSKLVRRVIKGVSYEMTVHLGDTTEGDEMLEIDAETGAVIWRASHQWWA